MLIVAHARLGPRQLFRAHVTYEPVPQAFCGAAIKLVVGADTFEQCRVLRLAPLLVDDDAVASGRHILGAFLGVKSFQVFQ